MDVSQNSAYPSHDHPPTFIALVLSVAQVGKLSLSYGRNHHTTHSD